MVWRRANGPYRYIRTPKEATMEATKSRISRAKKPTVKGAEAEPRISVEEDV